MTTEESKTMRQKAAQYVLEMNNRAKKLYQVNADIATREEKYKKETDNLFHERAELREQLLEDMKVMGMTSIKLDSGDAFFISHRTKYLPKNPLQFQSWAIENNLVKVDNDMVKTFLGRLEALPDFIEKFEAESIGVRKAKKEKSGPDTD